MRLRARILTGFAIVVALIVALSTGVVLSQRNQLTGQLDDRLESVVPLRPPRPAPPAEGQDRQDGEQRTEPQRPISDIFIATKSGDGTVDVMVQGELLSAVPDLSGKEFASERTFYDLVSSDGSTSFRALADPVGPDGDTVVIAVPTTDVDATIQRLVLVFIIATLLVTALLGVIAWWVVHLGLRPILAITQTARSVTAGERGERAPNSDGQTEAGQLAGAFNVMLDQRDEAEDRLRQFVSDASHELRTPLTSIRGYLDLYAEGGFREPGQLDDVVRRMQSEAGRMSSLIENLLQLARLDEEQPLQLSPVDIEQLVEDVVSSARVAHPGRSVEVEALLSEQVVEIDKHKISQLVACLVDNALIHAPDASVWVKAERSPAELLLAVVDDGPGLTHEETQRVFDRFYRGDPARARTTGGSGLGLGIAKSIAHAHHGELHLTSSPGDGCTFELRIPLPTSSRSTAM